MAGSLLKNFKSDLKKNELLRNQSKKKYKTGQNFKDRRERDKKVMDQIRDAFNPFDVKTTRQKFDVLGREATGKTGKPAIAKQIGEDQRRQSYRAHKMLKNKVGGMVDRRFGEKDKSLSTEEKMVRRYAAERLKQTKKSSMYNLEDQEDNEELTHGGRALSFEEELFEGDLGVDDDFSKRPFDEGQEEEEAPRKKSKQEVMSEIIQKSKMHKAARQQEKAEMEQAVDELNDPEAFEMLLQDLKSFDKEHNPDSKQSQEGLDYDVAVREMTYDRRAAPGDRTKTEEELEEERKRKEKERLESRQKRMEGDELDDDLEAENDAELFGLQHGESDAENEQEFEDEENSASEEDEKPESKAFCPQTLKELRNAIKDNIGNLAKIIKANDPSRAAGNKEKLAKLTPLICEYAIKYADRDEFVKLVDTIRDLTEKSPEEVGVWFRQEIDKIHKSDKWTKSSLLIYTLIGLLFSTSDQWHLVANGATLIAARHLFQSIDMAPRNIFVSVYLCQTLLHFQRISKRYIPEVSAYLLRTLAAATSTGIARRLVRNSNQKIALDTDKFTNTKLQPLQLSKLDKYTHERLILECVHTVDIAASTWKGQIAFTEVFEPFIETLELLPSNAVVEQVSEKLKKLNKFALAERRPLLLQEFRAMPLVTKAPAFEENFNPEFKHLDMNPERRELSKLRTEFKRERKTALKEIRRDTEFEARQRLDEKRNEAAAYHKMLQRLTDQVQSEEGAEKNRYEREKRNRKLHRR